MEGGGQCVGDNLKNFYDDCVQRTKSRLGSNRFWNKTKNGTGILSNNSTINPQFYNWNKAYINYCTGILHQGYRRQPVQVNMFQYLYFKGTNVTISTFKYLIEKKGLQSSQQAILAGFSAGGCGVFTWANYFRDLLPESVKVYAISDSGYFTDYPPGEPFTIMPTMADAAFDLQTDIFPMQCTDRFDDKLAFFCLTQDRIADLVKVPLLVINSQYDSWSLNQIAGFRCVENGTLYPCNQTVIDFIADFRVFYVEQIKNLTQNKPNRAAYLPACLTHGLTQNFVFDSLNWTIPENSTNTVSYIIKQFINEQFATDPNHLFYSDELNWPGNYRCSNLSMNPQQINYQQF